RALRRCPLPFPQKHPPSDACPANRTKPVKPSSKATALSPACEAKTHTRVNLSSERESLQARLSNRKQPALPSFDEAFLFTKSNDVPENFPQRPDSRMRERWNKSGGLRLGMATGHPFPLPR